MKKTHLTKGLFAALLLASPLAGADSKYPASDFEPVILYQDSDYISKHKQPAKAPGAPQKAAGFAEQGEAAAPSAAPAAAESAAKSGGESNMLKDNAPIALVALAIVGFMFWSSKKSPKAPAGGGETGVARYLRQRETGAAASGETGVARYLKQQEGAAGGAGETGVARYLKERG